PHTPSTRPWARPPPTSRSPSTTEPTSSPRRALTTTDASPTSGATTSTRATTGSCSAPAPTSQPVRWTISIPRSPSTSRSRPGRSTITSRCCSVRSPTAPTAAAEPPIDTRGSRPPAGSDPQQTAEAGRTPNPAGLADRLVTATAARPSRPCAEELAEQEDEQGQTDIESVRQGGEPTHAGLPRLAASRDPRSQRHLAAVGRLRDCAHRRQQ